MTRLVERVRSGDKLLVGVVHLLALPGSPGHSSRSEVTERALADARALASAGFAGFVLENFGDAPVFPDQVPPSTVAEMSVLAERLRVAVGPELLVGVNVLRNDAAAALSIAAAAGGDFVRVNVHTGVAFADQGMLVGRAHDTLRLRRALAADVAILADVAVKHALMPAGFSLERAAEDTVHRGLADGLIVTGTGTGSATARADLDTVRAAIPRVPLFAGSGVTDETLAGTLRVADGVIVGTWLKQNGDVHRPIDPERARALARIAKSVPRS